jgi:phosphoribosylcarboxyaminoimidazole (NCAIR) mutase
MFLMQKAVIIKTSKGSDLNLSNTADILRAFSIPVSYVSLKNISSIKTRHSKSLCFIASLDSSVIKKLSQLKPTSPVLLIPPIDTFKANLSRLQHFAFEMIEYPFTSFAIGKAGAINAGLFAVSLAALKNKKIQKKLISYRKIQTQKVLNHSVPKD